MREKDTPAGENRRLFDKTLLEKLKAAPLGTSDHTVLMETIRRTPAQQPHLRFSESEMLTAKGRRPEWRDRQAALLRSGRPSRSS